MNARVQLPQGCLGETETKLSSGCALSAGTAGLSKRALSSHLFLPSSHPFYCASTRSDIKPERKAQRGTGPAKK